MKMLLISVVMLVICIADVRASTGCDLSNRVLNYIVAPRHFDVSSETVNLLRKDGISDMQISDAIYDVYKDGRAAKLGDGALDRAVFWFGRIAPTNNLFKLKTIAITSTNHCGEVATRQFILRKCGDKEGLEFVARILDGDDISVAKKCEVWPAMTKGVRLMGSKKDSTLKYVCEFVEKRLDKVDDCVAADRFLCEFRTGYKNSDERIAFVNEVLKGRFERCSESCMKYFRNAMKEIHD